MANYEAQIKPTGLKVKNLVDCLYAVVSSIQGICAKLDDDGGVPSTTYEANVFTAIFNGKIENSRGSVVMNQITAKEQEFLIINAGGVTRQAVERFIDQVYDMVETLTEQLDGDSLSDTNYEALVYTALTMSYDDDSNKIGSLLGGNYQKIAVDILYAFVKMIHVLTDKLDDDGTVTGTNYEALWDTAVILMQVENSRASVAGNALTTFNP